MEIDYSLNYAIDALYYLINGVFIPLEFYYYYSKIGEPKPAILDY